MKTGIALIATLVVADSAAANHRIDTSSCRLQNISNKDSFSCSCVGGSGDYDWHFSDLPDGWSAQRDRLFTKEGRFDQKKAYGTRVEVIDRKTNSSYKRSLFFNFDNSKIGRVFDFDYDFNVDLLLPSNRNSSIFTGFNNFDNLFQSCQAIGGGSGLSKLRTYFLGNALYQDDSKNPYISRLPRDDEVDKLINSSSSKQIRNVIVNVVRSRNGCNNITKWLENLLRKLRTKITSFRNDIDGLKKTITTIEEQIKFLQAQLKQAESSTSTIAGFNNQIKIVRQQISKFQASRNQLQIDLKTSNKNIQDFQSELSKYNVEIKKVKEQDTKVASKIKGIDTEISKLQERLNKLKADRENANSQRAELSKNITLLQTKIGQVTVKIEAARVTSNQIREKIKKINNGITVAQNKIEELQKAIKQADTKLRATQIKTKIATLEKDLASATSKLKNIEPIFKDLNDNLDDLSKIDSSNFYGSCWKNLFNDDQITFTTRDDDDQIEFRGKINFQKYLTKVFGNVGGNIRAGDFGVVTVSADTDDDVSIQLRRVNIFSNKWVKTYGDIEDDDFNNDAKTEDDIGCAANNSGARSFKGQIKSIRKNIAKVIDDKGQECSLFLGGCTRIETADRELPQAGDDVYWKGVNKRGGKATEYEVSHLSCF